MPSQVQLLCKNGFLAADTLRRMRTDKARVNVSIPGGSSDAFIYTAKRDWLFGTAKAVRRFETGMEPEQDEDWDTIAINWDGMNTAFRAYAKRFWNVYDRYALLRGKSLAEE